MPKTSILIPVRNAQRHLAECLDSVLLQSLGDIEVVCVDNGSTDSSPAILAAYEAKDPRVKVLDGAGGKGAGAARNIAMGAATGEWLHFVDADDIVEERAEEEALAFAVQHGLDVAVFGAVEYDDATGAVTPLPLDLKVRPDDDRFLRAYATCPWNKLFRRSYIEENRIRFQEIPRANDLAFTVEALCRTRRVATLDRPLYRYRIHGGGSLQETKGDTPGIWREALREARERLVAAREYDRRCRAFDILCADVRLANAETLPARILASIRRRGFVSFAKHLAGYVKRRMAR